MNNFEQGPIRPPAEADSLLIRTTRGCPWNKCNFCTLFKGMQFSIRKVDEILSDIEKVRLFYGNTHFETCFLQDGDSFAMRTKDLIQLLTALKRSFPTLKRISSYGRAQTIMRKTEAEMGEISDAGLNMIYSGIESGSDKVLTMVNKGVTQYTLIESSKRVKNAGMSIMAFAILGLGGKELSNEHVLGTAHVLNSINPNSIRIMSLAVKKQTELWSLIESGSFTMLSEVEMIEEQRRLLDKLDNIQSHYGNFHGINLLTEIEGFLPEEKDKLLSIIDEFLALSPELQSNFILGRRIGRYGRLTGFQHNPGFESIEQQLKSVQSKGSPLESHFHDMRNRII